MNAVERLVINCPRAKSDMTPCVARDGKVGANGPVCIGCGVSILSELQLLAERYTPARNALATLNASDHDGQAEALKTCVASYVEVAAAAEQSAQEAFLNAARELSARNAQKTEIVCRGQVSLDCRHGRPTEEGTTLGGDGTFNGESIVCNACYAMLLPWTPSGMARVDELDLAIALVRERITLLRLHANPQQLLEEVEKFVENLDDFEFENDDQAELTRRTAHAGLQLATAEVKRRTVPLEMYSTLLDVQTLAELLPEDIADEITRTLARANEIYRVDDRAQEVTESDG